MFHTKLHKKTEVATTDWLIVCAWELVAHFANPLPISVSDLICLLLFMFSLWLSASVITSKNCTVTEIIIRICIQRNVCFTILFLQQL